MDFTTVFVWGLWPVKVLVIIDHFARRLVAVRPLKRPNAAKTIPVVEEAFRKFGPPKHVITDQDSVFISTEFKAFIEKWTGRKPRYGAIGEHGSVSVTERVIKTFRYEWLARVLLIGGFHRLYRVCSEFVEWYNTWRPHLTLGGFTPGYFYCRDYPEPVPRNAKAVPVNLERRVFQETRVTGYRLKDAA